MRAAAGAAADLAAACCAVSAGVHAGLAAEHGAASPVAGGGFAAAALALGAAAAAVTRRPRSAVAAAAAAALGAALAAYAVAVTVGLPAVHPGREPVDRLGLATKAVEAAGLLACLALVRARRGRVRATRYRPAPLPLLGLVSLFAALVALAVSGGHPPHGAAAGKEPVTGNTKEDVKIGSAGTRGDDAVAWRRDQLVAAGFALPLAAALARDPRHDVHALIELVERGCAPELAARILAPIDGGTAA